MKAIDRFVDIRMEVRVEQPAAAELRTLLKEWGLTASVQEQLWVIAYDAAEQIRTVAEVARGSYHDVDIHLPAVLAVPLVAGVDRFKIAHNHPTGDPTPTLIDVDMTRKVMIAANACGLSFDDHIVVAPNDNFYSFAERGLLVPNAALATAAKTTHRRAIDA